MATQECQHPRRVTGMLEFDFARPVAPDGPRYSVPLSVSVCETCGHIEFYGMFHPQLCAWLKGTDDAVN